MQRWWRRLFYYLLIGALLVLMVNYFTRVEQSESMPYLIENPASGYAGMSRLFAADDLLYMSWVEQIGAKATLKYATFDGETWSSPRQIAEGTDWFVNWADFPTIAVNKGNVFAHYLQKSAPDTYAYDIKYRVYQADSGQWTAAKKLHTDTTQSEHGFVSVIPYKDGFMASWLDGRTTVNRPDSLKQMTLRAGIITANGSLGKQWELDERVCDCCATSITDTPEGPIVAYRDRSANEVRDIYTVQLVDTLWSDPKAVFNDNWVINGCPVNGPSISNNAGLSSVVWFTDANETAQVNLATSQGGDTNFDQIDFSETETLGRVATKVDALGNTYLLYMTDRGTTAILNLTTVEPNGNTQTEILATIPSLRASGFPQLELMENGLLVSFTKSTDKQSSIETLYIPY